MSLANEDRNLLVRLYLEKARLYMSDAEQLLEIGSVSSAANRLYYAVFHAMHALFVANGITTKSHHGANAQFHMHFIRTGLLEPRFGQFVTTLESLREKADYDVVYNISPAEMDAMKPMAYELIGLIENMLQVPES